MVKLFGMEMILIVLPVGLAWASPIDSTTENTITAVQQHAQGSVHTVSDFDESKVIIRPGALIRGHGTSEWNYVCPTGGAGSKSFEFSATADYPLKRVNILGLNNVDKTASAQLSKNSFTAEFMHLSCEEQIGKLCAYDFDGTIKGEVEKTKMSLGVIRDRAPENPKVREACKSLVGPTRPRCSDFRLSDFEDCRVL